MPTAADIVVVQPTTVSVSAGGDVVVQVDAPGGTCASLRVAGAGAARGVVNATSQPLAVVGNVLLDSGGTLETGLVSSSAGSLTMGQGGIYAIVVPSVPPPGALRVSGTATLTGGVLGVRALVPVSSWPPTNSATSAQQGVGAGFTQQVVLRFATDGGTGFQTYLDQGGGTFGYTPVRYASALALTRGPPQSIVAVGFPAAAGYIVAAGLPIVGVVMLALFLIFFIMSRFDRVPRWWSASPSTAAATAEPTPAPVRTVTSRKDPTDDFAYMATVDPAPVLAGDTRSTGWHESNSNTPDHSVGGATPEGTLRGGIGYEAPPPEPPPVPPPPVPPPALVPPPSGSQDDDEPESQSYEPDDYEAPPPLPAFSPSLLVVPDTIVTPYQERPAEGADPNPFTRRHDGDTLTRPYESQLERELRGGVYEVSGHDTLAVPPLRALQAEEDARARRDTFEYATPPTFGLAEPSEFVQSLSALPAPVTVAPSPRDMIVGDAPPSLATPVPVGTFHTLVLRVAFPDTTQLGVRSFTVPVRFTTYEALEFIQAKLGGAVSSARMGLRVNAHEGPPLPEAFLLSPSFPFLANDRTLEDYDHEIQLEARVLQWDFTQAVLRLRFAPTFPIASKAYLVPYGWTVAQVERYVIDALSASGVDGTGCRLSAPDFSSDASFDMMVIRDVMAASDSFPFLAQDLPLQRFQKLVETAPYLLMVNPAGGPAGVAKAPPMSPPPHTAEDAFSRGAMVDRVDAAPAREFSPPPALVAPSADDWAKLEERLVEAASQPEKAPPTAFPDASMLPPPPPPPIQLAPPSLATAYEEREAVAREHAAPPEGAFVAPPSLALPPSLGGAGAGGGAEAVDDLGVQVAFPSELGLPVRKFRLSRATLVSEAMLAIARDVSLSPQGATLSVDPLSKGLGMYQDEPNFPFLNPTFALEQYV